MFCKKAGSMDGTGDHWVSSDMLSWYRFKICHGHDRRVVQKYCGSTCGFPACLEQAVLPTEAEKPEPDVLANDRIRQGNGSYARTLFDRRPTDDEVV